MLTLLQIRAKVLNLSLIPYRSGGDGWVGWAGSDGVWEVAEYRLDKLEYFLFYFRH